MFVEGARETTPKTASRLKTRPFCFNIKDEDHAKKIKGIMEDSIEFKVPSVVDVGLGKSWGDAK